VFLKETPTTVGLPEKKREKGRGKERGGEGEKGRERERERERKKGDTREAATTYSRIY